MQLMVGIIKGLVPSGHRLITSRQERVPPPTWPRRPGRRSLVGIPKSLEGLTDTKKQSEFVLVVSPFFVCFISVEVPCILRFLKLLSSIIMLLTFVPRLVFYLLPFMNTFFYLFASLFFLLASL